jgi:hypothetical protein
MRFPVEGVMLGNNIFATFLVTGLYIIFYDILREGIKAKSAIKILSAIGRMLLPVAISFFIIWILPVFNPAILLTLTVLPNLILIEGGVLIVLMGVLFYALREWRWAQAGILVAFSLVYFLIHHPED